MMQAAFYRVPATLLEGFDLVKIMNELYNWWLAAHDANDTTQTTVVTATGNFTDHTKSDTFLTEMTTLCTVFINRGVDLSKIIEKTFDDAAGKYDFTTSV